MTIRRGRPRGFTLLELTLATATAAVIAMALYASLNIAMTARSAAHRAVALDRRAAIAADLVVRDLEAVLPPTGVLAGPFIAEVGQGGSLVSFHAFPPAIGAGTADLPQRVELELVSPGVLVRRRQANLLAPTETVLDEEVIARGVSAFLLRYFDGEAWVDTWDSSAPETLEEGVLPLAAELTLTFEGDAESAGGGVETPRVTVVRLVRMPFGSDVRAPTGEAPAGGLGGGT